MHWDEHFMRQINSKQPEAFREVFNEFYNSLVYFAVRYVERVEIAEDLVQELFAGLWESKTVHTSYNGFKTFLYTSVKHACLDYLKHKNVEGKYISYMLEHPESEEELAAKITEEEIYRLFLKILEELPERRKIVFKLHLQGKKNEEIARLLRVSVETVKTAKKEAVRYFKKRLGDAFYVLSFLAGGL